MTYFEFEKEKDTLICIDSDGCAMDTMNVKHFECFGPEYVKSYGLEAYEEEALAYWNEINLFTTTRGINRFKGLAMGLREMANRHNLCISGLEEFEKWTTESKELSNPALLTRCQASKNECMEKALLWSIHVNLAIKALPADDKPFDFVKETMDRMSEASDLVAVSSANGEAVDHEWQKHGLKETCRSLLCQEAGSKAHCISEVLKKGYQKEKTLMVGDAVGDYEAAKKNGVWFYPIIVGREGESWMKLRDEAYPKLVEGTFDADYQAQLIASFEAALGK